MVSHVCYQGLRWARFLYSHSKPLPTLFFFLLCLISSSIVRCLLTGLEFKIENVFIILYGLPWWLRGKESTCNAEDAAGTTGWIPGSGRSPGGESHWQPTPVFLPGKFHRQRNLAGYRPWGLQNCQTWQSDLTILLYHKFERPWINI